MSAPENQKPLQPEPVPSNGHRKKYLWGFTLFLILIALVCFCLWFFYYKFHESTDDAYANGHLINVNSAISSSVLVYYADDTDLVREGQVLVQLDPTVYKVTFEKELATLCSMILQVKELYDQVDVEKAEVESKTIAFSKAQYDFNNRAQLIGSQAISNEDYTHAKDDQSIAESELKVAQSRLKVAQDAVGNTAWEKHPKIEEQKGNVRKAYYDLQHCVIKAPVTGYVAQRNVEVGEWVNPRRPLMAVIPEKGVWIDANFKETQLKNMRIGQPATVWFDLYGSKVKYEGKVIGIASGSGNVFSLIPPQNATGNWIKIVQRLPVRISLDPETLKSYPSRLGISANVTVDTSNLDLPILSQTTSIRPVSTTHVFNIDLEKVNKIMDEVINQHQRE